MRRIAKASAVAGVFLWAAACSNDAEESNSTRNAAVADSGQSPADSGASDDRRDAGSDSGTDAADAATDAESADATQSSVDELWVLETRLWSPDGEGATGYAVPVEQLAGNIDNKNGVEQAGGGVVYAQAGKPTGVFLLTDGETGVATRFEVADGNKLVAGKQISFEGEGVHSGFATVAWIDDHVAYWLDSAQLQVIRFDPTALQIKNVFPIEGIAREGFRAWFSDRPVVREDGVFFTINWSALDELELDSPAGSKLVHIDPSNDKVTVTSDDRCTSLLMSMTTRDGDSYFFSSYENTYTRIASKGKRGVPDCALRLRKGEKKFDANWSLDIAKRTDGRPADGVLPGAGNTMWLRVFHADKLDEQPTGFEAIDGAAAWQWHELDLDDEAPAQENTQRPYSPHGFGAVVTQGRSFFLVANEDYSSSELLELKDNGFTKLATVKGELTTLIRVR